jgi:hypothetical protein
VPATRSALSGVVELDPDHVGSNFVLDVVEDEVDRGTGALETPCQSTFVILAPSGSSVSNPNAMIADAGRAILSGCRQTADAVDRTGDSGGVAGPPAPMSIALPSTPADGAIRLLPTG